MDIKLEEALARVETAYSELVEIANNIVTPITAGMQEIIDKISNSINNLAIDQLRDYILMLQLKAFDISEIKEKAAMKAELAVALQKEQFAINFNGVDGSAAVKDKQALVNTSAEVASSALYNLVANMLKTKLDQAHRLVDALKSVLMSRMQETKFMNIGATNDIPSTAGSDYNSKKTILNEQF